MERLLQEDPKPAWKLIAIPWILGAIAVFGLILYDRMTGREDHARKSLLWLLSMTPIFALVLVKISRRVRPRGTWMVSEEGLRFTSRSGETRWEIPWGKISRMKNTSVSLVIWWRGVAPNSAGGDGEHRAVLFLRDPDAAELMTLWRQNHVKGKGEVEVEHPVGGHGNSERL